MKALRVVALVLVATIAVVLVLTLAGTAAIALLVYVLFLAAVLLAVVVSRLQKTLPPAPGFDRLLPGSAGRKDAGVEQLETIRRRVRMASYSEIELYSRLRPLAHEIAAARLSRRYNVDLDREPGRAKRLVGDGRVWELIDPARGRPVDPMARGWSEKELEQLIEELENL